MNDIEKARTWTQFIASRPEFVAGEALLTQFVGGQVEQLCQCGCNSFTFHAVETDHAPLAVPGRDGGVAFELVFRTVNPGETVEFRVWVNGAGGLSGIEVECRGRSHAMPDVVPLIGPPVHVDGVLAANSMPKQGRVVPGYC